MFHFKIWFRLCVTRRLKAAIVEPETSTARKRLGNPVSATRDTQATTEELFGTVFSIKSV
jgi:hypothetical protein